MRGFPLRHSILLSAALCISACDSGVDDQPSPPPAPTVSAASFCEQGFTQSEHFTASSSIDGQNGWARTAAGFDELVENVGAGAQAGRNVWKLSNKVVSGAFGNQPVSPQLSQSAGEAAVRSSGGGDAMEAVFWMRPVSPSADGSSITISLSPASGDRLAYFRIINDLDANGGYRTVVIDYLDVHNTGDFRTYPSSSGMNRVAWTKVRLVMETADGGSNDVFRIFLDDRLVGTRSTWEDYFTWSSGGNSITLAASRLMFRVAGAASTVDASFADANAQGFYFDSLCYRVYNRAAPDSTIQSYRTGFES